MKIMKAILPLFVAAVFFSSLPAFAKYSGGSGTELDPWQISCPNDLLYLGIHTEDYNSCFILTSDIDLVNYTFTTAIIAPYSIETPFTGLLDGKNFKIINLKIDANNSNSINLGLFGHLGRIGRISNLGAVNINIIGGDNSSYIGGIAGNNEGTISNCYSIISVTGGDNLYSVGGLVGENYYGKIHKCFSTASINCGNNSYSIGGLIGSNFYTDINDCYSTGIVTAGASSEQIGGLDGTNYNGKIFNCHSECIVSGSTNSKSLGGLVGYGDYSEINNSFSTGKITGFSNVGGLAGNHTGRINECYATGNVVKCDISSSNLGGLVGNNDSDIFRCYATGSVNGYGNVGGLLGDSQDNIISNSYAQGDVNGQGYIGGLIGHNVYGTVINCYSIGHVDSNEDSSNVGGLIGKNRFGMIIYSYWDIDTSGITESSGGEGLKDLEIRDINSFSHWSAEPSIWTINNRNDYPHLYWEKMQGEDINSPLLTTLLDGIGSEEEPFLISDINDFEEIGGYPNQIRSNIYYKLTSDISFSGREFRKVLIPIFSGNFDGSNYKIKNLNIDSSNEQNNFLGLFGKVNQDVNIANLYVEDINIIGGYSQYVGGLSGANYGNIRNCIITGTITGGYFSGGLVGYNYGTISNCIKSGNFVATDYADYFGGLIGVNFGLICNCSVNGSLKGGNFSAYAGGLVGNNRNTINHCYADIEIISGSNTIIIGGLSGGNEGGTVTNCYSTGLLTVGSSSEAIGGLVGYNNYGDISNCYSQSSIIFGITSQKIGGFAGYNFNHGNISNCFWDIQASGILDGVGYNTGTTINLLGKTTADMQIQETFSGSPTYWDFVGETANGTEDIWRMPCQTGYPILSWQVCSYYSGGSGTETEPWQISGPNDLLCLAKHPEDYNSCFILTSDINLADYTFTTAVIAPDINNINFEFDGPAFGGMFNGNGLAISNLNIDTNGIGNGWLGLFGKTGAESEIKNLCIEDVNITGKDGELSFLFPNSIALGGLAGENHGFVNNCYSTGIVRGGFEFGGVTGRNFGTMSFCNSIVSIIGGEKATVLGGLTGYNIGTINNSSASGQITGGTEGIFGGLSGYNIGIINNCYATGMVKGENNSGCLGGLIGHNSGSVNNCYAKGTVRGEHNSLILGGLIGYNSGQVNNSYATGAVTAWSDSQYLGGITGWHTNQTIENCFWDRQTSGRTNGVGYYDGGTIVNLLGKTTLEMKIQETFTGAPAFWDFAGETINGTEDIWHMPYQATGYPMLFWQKDIPGDFSGSYGVNFADYLVLANAWLSRPADSNWNTKSDLYQDSRIDTLDLKILMDNWLIE